jgi:hypothetical protein
VAFSNFHEVFPSIDQTETLGRGHLIRQHLKQTSLAQKAAFALIDAGMPDWLKAEIS